LEHKPEPEDNNQATSSTDQKLQHQPNIKTMLPIMLLTNNFLTTLERDLPREVPEVLPPSEESSRLLMTTDQEPLMQVSSRSACTTSESE